MIPDYSRTKSWLRPAVLATPAALALVLAATGTADAATAYRFFRFSPTQLRSGVAEQFSEFRLYSGSSTATPTQLLYPTGTTATFTGGSAVVNNNEGPDKTIDGDLNTKWYNGGNGSSIAALVIDVGSGNTLTPDGYTFGTANDANNRDPISWNLEGSADGTTWTLIDVRQNYATPTDRNKLLPVFTIPATLTPYFSSYTTPNPVVLNGASTSLTYQTAAATAVTLSPSTGTALGLSGTNVAVDPPDGVDTTYTLTASSTSAPSSPSIKNFTVRSVAGGTVTYQYVRFTPVKTGAIQLADINFYNGSTTPVAVSAVTYADGTAETGTEGPSSLKDNNPATKWYNPATKAVVFDFGSQQTIRSYSFTTGGDSGLYPDRNPTRWIMEGSNDNTTWTMIENMTAFDYPIPLANNSVLNVPLPGASLRPLVRTLLAQRDPFFADQPTTIYYDVVSASKVTLQIGAGTETEMTNGFQDVTPPVSGTESYTVRVYPGDLASVYTKVFTLGGAMTTAPATINYPNGFANSGHADFTFNGSSVLSNDSFTIPLPGNVTRLRLLPDLADQKGSIWFNNKVSVANGFDTTFGAQLTTLNRGYGAEGLAFVIQNTADGLTSLPDPAEKGPTSNSFVIELSCWDNGAAPPNEAKIRILKGVNGTTTPVTTVDLNTITAAKAILRGQNFATFTGDYQSAPYTVHVTYASGALSITLDGIPVLTNFPVTLDDAVDTSGKAYVGFTSRAGQLTQATDVTSWTLTSGSVTPTTDLKITASTFNVAAGTLALTFDSVSGTTYRVTHSSTLNGTDWAQVGSPVTANSGSTSTTVTFTPGSKDFFRVEVAP